MAIENVGVAMPKRIRYFFGLIMGLLPAWLCGQINLTGTVKDSLGTSLELANVIALATETNTMVSYGITNNLGVFELTLPKNSKLQIQISYVGMQTLKTDLETQESDLVKEYILSSENMLDEVELVYEMPIQIKGDTLVYNADSFQNGSERKLEDVLEKLPGVEINEEGQIEVEGKVVNKLMVNGKDFFDGDTKLASKNIPSKAVDKIQVLRNYAEIGQLRSVANNQDNVAINIKLKEGKEKFWFGDVTLGAGAAPENALYVVQPKLFYYTPKYTLNFIGDFNNLGELALNRRDIRNFTGGFRSANRNSGTNINLGDTGLDFLTPPDAALAINSKLASTNFSYSPSGTLDLSGFLIYSHSKVDAKEISFLRYTDPELGIPDERSEQLAYEDTRQAVAKLSASWQPNFRNQLDYDVFAQYSDIAQNQNVGSSVLGESDRVDDYAPYRIAQNLNYYYTLSDDHIFAFEVQQQYKKEDPLYRLRLEGLDEGENPFDQTARSLGFNTEQMGYEYVQNRQIRAQQWDAKVDYYYIINPKNNLNITLGNIFSRQDFDSSFFQILDDGTPFDPVPEINEGKSVNDVLYQFSDTYLGVHHRLKSGIFTFTSGFSWHRYTNSNEQFDTRVKDNFFRFLPDFETRLQLKKSESLTFRYAMQNQFTDVSKLAEGLVLLNSNNIVYGNGDLQNALSHNISLRYSSFNLFNYTNVFARIAYASAIDQIRSLTDFENVIRTTTYFNSGFSDETLNAFGRVQRTFGKIRASMNVGFSYARINQFIEGQRSVNTAFTQTYTPGLRSNFKIAPNFNLRYRHSITDNNQGGGKSQFVTQQPTLGVDAYIAKAVTLNSDYAYTRQKLGNGQSQSFQTWDASLRYRKNRDAKWEYEVKATNLLNIDKQIRNGANSVAVFAAETFIQPRFVSVRVVYSL